MPMIRCRRRKRGDVQKNAASQGAEITDPLRSDQESSRRRRREKGETMNLNGTLDAVKKALSSPDNDVVKKSWSVGTGLVGYDLQAPALQLYPFMELMTMLRNDIPRVRGNGDSATRWKAITGINTANTHPGLSEGNRGATIASSVANYTAAYIGLGLEDSVTFEADYAATGFDDARAKAVLGLLRALMLQEEAQLLGGNASLSLGTTPTPSLSASGSGATLPGAPTTYSVICVALSHQGWLRSSLANGVIGQLSKTNVDGSTDTINGGAAQKSAAATQAVTLGQTLFCSVTPVEGAVAYAWFTGTAGSEKLEAITSINSVAFSAPLNGTRQAASALTAADYSKDATYNMDGLLSFAKSASGSVLKVAATGTAGTGTGLSSDGAGGVLEINDALQAMFDTWRMGPTDILVSSKGIRRINALCIGNGGAPLFRFVMNDKGGVAGLAAGATIGNYLNPITNTLIRVRVHPNMPAGTLLGYAKEIPYPLNGVGSVFQVKCRNEYYQLEWALRARKYEYGCYVDEVLQHYAPFTLLKVSNYADL
jgi:hypothetical protein